MIIPKSILNAAASLSVALLVAAGTAQADTLAFFEFTGGSDISTAPASSNYTISTFAPGPVYANTAWLPSPSSAYDTFGIRPYTTTYNEDTGVWTNGISGLGAGAANYANGDFYAAFVITPAAGSAIDLTSLSFKLGIGGKNGATWGVSANVEIQIGDNEPIKIGTAQSLNNGNSTAPAGDLWNTNTFDLTSVVGTSFEQITDAITVYLYFFGGRYYTDDHFWTYRVDEMKVEGVSSQVIPEPATAILLIAIGGFSFASFRRRR